MTRKFGTDRNGKPFKKAVRKLVWAKAQIVAGADPARQRKDVFGAWIAWSEFGVTDAGGMGWEIDHIRPVAMGGNDNIENLQALHWENNRKKNNYWSLDEHLKKARS